MKKLKKYIDIDDLIFDITLFLIFILFNLLVQKDRSFVKSINPLVMMAVLGFMILLVPWYLGVISGNYKKYKEKLSGMGAVVNIVLTLGFLSSAAIVIGVPAMLTYYDYSEYMSLFLVFLVLMGFLALLLGWFSGLTYLDNIDNPEKAGEGLSSYVSAVLSILTPIVGFSGFLYSLMEGFTALTAFSITLLCLSFIYFSKKDFFKSIFTPDIVRHYIFPFLISSSLVFCHEIVFDLMALNSTGSSTGDNIFMLSITGVIPARIIMLFSPPIKIVNFIIGISSISLIVYDTIF